MRVITRMVGAMHDHGDALLSLADAYCAAVGRSHARVATLCANDGKFFKRVQEGGTFTVATFDRIVGWFSDRWPEGVEWPAGVPRPLPRPVSGAA
jgi:hypothetical protein